MSKETKNLLFVIITLVINVLAPILMIDMYKDYTAKSFIIGTPDKIVKIENLDVEDYVFQENLSTMNFIGNGNENEYIFNYYFESKDFDSTTSNYLMYINDYMLSITNLEAKAISGQHTRYFKDANQEICNEVDIEVTFEFYSTYSYLFVKIITPDITYFNGFRENPGLVLTLSRVDYGMIGNLEDYTAVATLQYQLEQLQQTYDILQQECSALQSKYNGAIKNNERLNDDIDSLTSQVANLTSQISNLETEINSLEAELESVNEISAELTASIANKQTTIDGLNNQVLELEESIRYYEEYIAGLESEDKVIATFKYNGSVYDIQTLDKGAYASIEAPVSTEYIVFNGWTVDGQVVDLATYVVNVNTVFVADITCYYDVTFVSEGETLDSKLVEKNSFATCSTEPVKDAYIFIGWSVDGATATDLTIYPITSNTQFIALFKMAPLTVSFYSRGLLPTLLGTKSVEYGDTVGDAGITPPDVANYEFIGWGTGWLEGTIILTTFEVRANLNLYAKYKEVLVSYRFQDQGVVLDYGDVHVGHQFTDIPQPLGRDGYKFLGWIVSGYSDFVDFDTYTVSKSYYSANAPLVFVAHYALPYGGTYTGNVNGTPVALDIKSYSDGTAWITSNSGNLTDFVTGDEVINKNGVISIEQDEIVSLGYTLTYNQSNDTWIYSKVTVDRDGVVTSKIDYVLSYAGHTGYDNCGVKFTSR